MMSDMLKIVICDDEVSSREKIEKICTKFFEKEEKVILQVENGAKLLEQLKEENYDIIFLDIEMKGIGGIDVKNKMEEQKIPGRIVFVTDHDEYVMDAFGKNVYGFVTKPVREENMLPKLQKLYKDWEDTSYVVIDEGITLPQKIEKSMIKYIQAAHVYTDIVLIDGEKKTTRKSLQEWEMELAKDGFIRIGRSYLVNVEYIQNVKEYVEMMGGEKIKIPHGKVEEVRGGYIQHLRRKARIL